MDNIQNEPIQPQEQSASLKPPLQPLDIKKSGLPVFILVGLVVMGFVVAAVIYAHFSKNNISKKISRSSASSTQKSLTSDSRPVVTSVEVLPIVGYSVNSKNAVVEDKPIPSLSLSGILFGKEGSIALINGRIVREGSLIDGARLVKVSSDRVELEFQGQKIILRSK